MKKIINWFLSLFSSSEKKVKRRAISDDEFNEIRSKKQKKLDSILEKISKNGIQSLSIHEKNFLDNYGKN